ncbi:MAG: hypothetical protein FJY85_01660 [Deltaproteobacteria bacterium]|nr:hypothetical protein [Deltaproteobacteria bacterium]
MNILAEIREEIRYADVEPKKRDMNILAVLFLVIPGIIGLYSVLWKGSSNGYIWMGGGALLAATRIVTPLFRMIFKLWIRFSVILGFFISRTLLTLIFFLVITPMGLIMRLMGKDPMDRKFDPRADTYWKKKEPETEQTVERYEKQF